MLRQSAISRPGRREAPKGNAAVVAGFSPSPSRSDSVLERGRERAAARARLTKSAARLTLVQLGACAAARGGAGAVSVYPSLHFSLAKSASLRHPRCPPWPCSYPLRITTVLNCGKTKIMNYPGRFPSSDCQQTTSELIPQAGVLKFSRPTASYQVTRSCRFTT